MCITLSDVFFSFVTIFSIIGLTATLYWLAALSSRPDDH